MASGRMGSNTRAVPAGARGRCRIRQQEHACLIGSAWTSSITRCRASCGSGTSCSPRSSGPTNFFAWALSVMFLVFSLRALLYKPFVRQIRTTRQMQELQPQIKALQKKYGKDRQRMALEMQKLQTRARVQPDPRLSADAGADPGVPRSVSRAAFVQPDHRRVGSAAPDRGREPGHRQLRVQPRPTSATSWTPICSAHPSAPS